MQITNKVLGSAALLCVCVAAGAVSYVTVSSEHIINSTLDSTPVGLTKPSVGQFTTVTSISGMTAGGDIVTTGAFRTSPTGAAAIGTGGIVNSGGYNGAGIILTGGLSVAGGTTLNNGALNGTFVGNPIFSGNTTFASTITGNLAGNASTSGGFLGTPNTCGTTGYSYGSDRSGNALCGNAGNSFPGSGQAGAAGYQRLPGGLILEYINDSQQHSGRGSSSFALPISFPHACLSAQLTAMFVNPVGGTNNEGIGVYLQPGGCTTGNVSYYADTRSDGGIDSPYTVNGFAIGW